MSNANLIKNSSSGGHLRGSPVSDLSGSRAEKAATDSKKVENDFLKMLMAQIQNQDPMNPQETEEITRTMATLAQTQEAIESNKLLEKLVTAHEGEGLLSSADLIGKEVAYDASVVHLVNGNASFKYNLESIIDDRTPEGGANISDSRIKIKNEDGLVIYEVEGSKVAGMSTFDWDGVGFNNKKYPDGKYSIEVVAFDMLGRRVPSNSQERSGVIEEIRDNGGNIYFKIDGEFIPKGQIKVVKNKLAELLNQQLSNQTLVKEKLTMDN
jgi:flagellar basal-body rod modification protein FlgD